MTKRSLLILGSVLTLYGVYLLLGVIFRIDTGKLCFPIAIILFGVYLILRPKLFSHRPPLHINLFPNIRRRDQWTVAEENILMFVGDIKLDLTQAVIPAGETTMHLFGFVGDIDLIVPLEVGISVSSAAFLTTARIWNQKQDQFVSIFEQASPNYDQAEKKLRLECYFFVADIKVK